jgi:hypothetical protein
MVHATLQLESKRRYVTAAISEGGSLTLQGMAEKPKVGAVASRVQQL